MSGSLIATQFNIGPRIASQVLGSLYVQYRPTDATNPISQDTQIATIPAWITADAAGMGTRPFTYAKPVAFGMIDPDLAQVGDYLTGDFGTFFIASLDGLMPTQLVRCNKTITISRPTAPAASATFYGGASVASLTPLMTAWPASVINGTKGERGEVGLPGDTRLSWAAVLLPFAGVEILPGDWITTTDSPTALNFTVSACELTALGWRISAAGAVA